MRRSVGLLIILFLAPFHAPPTPARASGSAMAWTYLDKAQPSTPNRNPSGDYLIGSSGPGHTGRAFFTYDLTSLTGKVLHEATFSTVERTVNDCRQVAPIEIWRTGPITSTTTWQRPPRELELLSTQSLGEGMPCPGADLGVDMIGQVRAALARGDRSLTVEVRVAAEAEADITLGRTMQRARLSWSANRAPTVGGLKLDYPDAGCGTPEKNHAAGSGMRATATVRGASAQLYYAYWPVDRPEQRTESISGSFDLSGFGDGTVVAWSAQGRDLAEAGPWGRTCYFTVDTTAPQTLPIVSSKTNPGTGAPGVPWMFVFDAAGDAETTSFDWSLQDGGPGPRVIANHRGGRAKVAMTPRLVGVNRIEVAAVDAAGNRGPWVEYRFLVSDAPVISSDDFGPEHSPVAGKPGSFRLAPRMADVVAYLFDFGDGDGDGDGGVRQRVDAAADGTAVLDWTPEEGGLHAFTVSSVDRNDNVSEPSRLWFQVLDNHPHVYANTYRDFVGVSVSSDLPNAIRIVYTFDGGPMTSVDGSYAYVEVVPTPGGDNLFTAWAQLDDGTLSPPAEYKISRASSLAAEIWHR